MDRTTFDAQLTRLKSRWPKTYDPELMKLVWDTFQKETNQKFTRIVTRAISVLRSSPLIPDLLKLQEEITVEDKNALRDRSLTDGSIRGVLENAQRNTKLASKEFVDHCMKLLNDLLAGRINMQQFHEGADLLDTAAKVGVAR